MLISRPTCRGTPPRVGYRLSQCAAIVAYPFDKRSPVLIIDASTEYLNDAVNIHSRSPPHQELPPDDIPVRGRHTNVASRNEVSGSSPCLRLRSRQMDEIQFSSGSSSFWGRQGFPYRHSSEKGFPVQLKRGPTVRKEDGARVPRNGGTRHSDDGSHRS